MIMTENEFIARLHRQHKYIGDDAAFVDSKLYSADIFAQDVHFTLKWMSLEQIVYKAFAVNISDAVAMNATASQVLCMLQIPKTFTKEKIVRLNKALLKCAAQFDVDLIGGDTTVGDTLSISLAVISKANSYQPLFRHGIKQGSLLAYTGVLGDSKKGLMRLMRGGTLSTGARFIRPVLRQPFIKQVSRYLQAGMDISDGLLTDLSRLATINRLGFTFLAPIDKAIGCSGEEYEMLIAFDKRKKKSVIRRANQSRTAVTIFARATRRKYTDRCKAHHF